MQHRRGVGSRKGCVVHRLERGEEEKLMTTGVKTGKWYGVCEVIRGGVEEVRCVKVRRSVGGVVVTMGARRKDTS
jgi:hypothetical protein